MRLKRIRLKGDATPSIAVFFRDRWLPLRLVLSQGGHEPTPEENRIAVDMIALLGTGPAFRQYLDGLMDAWMSAHAGYEAPIEEASMIPFEPRSYRDFMLYQRHAVDAARGYARRFIPLGYLIGTAFERITGKTFPLYRPKRIWYEKPSYCLPVIQQGTGLRARARGRHCAAHQECCTQRGTGRHRRLCGVQ